MVVTVGTTLITCISTNKDVVLSFIISYLDIVVFHFPKLLVGWRTEICLRVTLSHRPIESLGVIIGP